MLKSETEWVLPISGTRSWAVNQGPDPDVIYLWNWTVPAEGQTSVLHLLKSSYLALSQKVKNNFINPVHKKGWMIVPNPWSVPQNLQWILKRHSNSDFASLWYLDWKFFVHQGKGREWCILHMVACCTPLRLEQNMDHLDFCNVKFN